MGERISVNDIDIDFISQQYIIASFHFIQEQKKIALLYVFVENRKFGYGVESALGRIYSLFLGACNLKIESKFSLVRGM